MTRRLPSDHAIPDSSQQPQPGHVLGGKYRVEREIGAGGMGVVFEVTPLLMGTRSAVKWLLPDDGEESLQRFVREARILGAIDHPHVVKVFDVNIDDRGAFMVMELLQGESLQARIERQGPLTAVDACTTRSSACPASRPRTKPASSIATSNRRTCSCA